MTAGYVYVLANSGMPELVKVGFTTRSPDERAKELGMVTGVPVPFLVVYQRLVTDCEAAEQYLHLKFSQMGFRVADNREFFRAPISRIVNEILHLPKEYTEEASPGDIPSGDEYIGSFVQKDTTPWLGVWEEAVASHYGLGSEFKDVGRAERLYKTAARLGCNLAYYRLGMIAINASDGRKGYSEAISIAREGVSHGNYACFLLLAKVYIELGDESNTEKALRNFFSTRHDGYNSELEKTLFIENALSHIIAQGLHLLPALDVSALLQLQQLKSQLIAIYDAIIVGFENSGEPLAIIGPYHEARHQIESM